MRAVRECISKTHVNCSSSDETTRAKKGKRDMLKIVAIQQKKLNKNLKISFEVPKKE